MSERITHIITEIRDKFYHLNNELQYEKQKNTLLENEVVSLQNKQSEISSIIVSKQDVIDALHLEILELNKKLEEHSTKNISVVNHDDLINDLVKEIDTCISQLKK
jgi:hypothetical protein